MVYSLRSYNERMSFDDITTYTTARNHVKLSVILPTYNESELITKLIKKIHDTLTGVQHEIIVVDDNSPDNTSILVESLINKYPVVLLQRKKRGVFSAQLDGVRVAAGEYVLLMDADFSHPPSKLIDMIKQMEEYDLVSCSRFLKESKIIAPFSRKWSTILLNLVLRRMLPLGVTDYSSIFLVVKKDKWKKLHFFYDSVWGEAGMEIFTQARINQMSVKEIPFTYNYREEGNSKSDKLWKYAFIYLKRAIDLKFFYKKAGRKE